MMDAAVVMLLFGVGYVSVLVGLIVYVNRKLS